MFRFYGLKEHYLFVLFYDSDKQKGKIMWTFKPGGRGRDRK